MRRIFLLSILVCGVVHSQELPNSKPHGINSTIKSSSDQRGTEKQPFVIKAQEAEKTPERIEQDRPENEEKADREERLVLWTIILGGATIFLALIAGGQIVMFWQQLRLMRNGVVDAKDVATAAKISAQAASDQVQTLIDSERAYVFVGVELVEKIVTAGSVTGWASIKFKNHGKTPAILKSIWGSAEPIGLNSYPASVSAESQSEIPSALVIGSGRNHTILVPFTVSRDDFLNIENQNMRLICFGKIEYLTIHRKTYETGYCWELTAIKEVGPGFKSGRFYLSNNKTLNYYT